MHCKSLSLKHLAKPYLLRCQTSPFASQNVSFHPAKRNLSSAQRLGAGCARKPYRPARRDFPPCGTLPLRAPSRRRDPPRHALQDKKQEILTTKDGEYLLHCQALATRLWRLLAVMLVRNGELLATLGAAGGQNATAILRGHSLTEAVLVHATAVVGLKCSFHLLYFLFIVI